MAMRKKGMNVQELIDKLQKIEDKSQMVGASIDHIRDDIIHCVPIYSVDQYLNGYGIGLDCGMVNTYWDGREVQTYNPETDLDEVIKNGKVIRKHAKVKNVKVVNKRKRS